MNKLHRNVWFAITVLYAVCVTTVALKHFVTSPWHVVGELGGDGAKNNFTYLYHSMYGSGYWFQGMNYPYGEHIVYTDGQPVLSVLLTHFKNVTAPEALTILWLLIDLSYVLAIIYVYLVLRHFKVGPLVAMAFSGLIIVFSPQLFRIQGHYALAYTCIIPMVFYWTVQYNERPKLKYCSFFFIAGCITAFLHLYYVAMMLIWVVSYAAGYFIFTKGPLVKKLKHILPLLIAIVGVFAMVAIVMKLTDPVTDRPITPLNNFYETCTRLRQLITSEHSHIWEYLRSKSLIYDLAGKGEGYAYLGLVIIITLASSFIIGLIKSMREKRLDILVEDAGFSPIWLFIAFVALVLGMGIPFVWHPAWLGYISVFKQFRSMGRFTWVFYHIVAVYTVVVIYKCYTFLVAKRKMVAGYTVLILSIAVWSYEAKGYIGYSRYRSDYAMYNYDMVFSALDQNWPSWLQDHHYNRDDFQAILLLPFYHIGTEKIWVGNSEWIITLGTKASLQLHLPIIDVMMSRSSWSQAQAQVKIAAGPYSEKPMLHDIKSTKPFLLLHFEEDSLNPDQKYILSASDYIGDHSQCHIYACYPERLMANDKQNADKVSAILPYMHETDTCIGNCGSHYINHFDEGHASEQLFGAGAVPYKEADTNIVANIPMKPARDSQQYEFSCWFLLSNKDYKSPDILLQSADSAGRIIGNTYIHTNKSVDSHGLWFRASQFFTPKRNCRSIRCILINVPKPTYIAMDEMMLRPADAVIISKSPDGTVMVNNHLFKAVR